MPGFPTVILPLSDTAAELHTKKVEAAESPEVKQQRPPEAGGECRRWSS